ncbi:MAG: hypothetical protein IJR59_03850 [Firmicutes bacterium]|nr:hypothetical protein [Bacillota bacterium]
MKGMDISLVLLFMVISPCLAAANTAVHFIRKKMLIGEIICYAIGMPLSVWLSTWGKWPETAPFLLVYAFSPLAVFAYLYMKYTFYGSDKTVKAAKIFSLVYSAVLAVMTLCVCLPALYSFLFEDSLFALVYAYYFSLVPVCYIITAVSEVIFQNRGKGLYDFY